MVFITLKDMRMSEENKTVLTTLTTLGVVAILLGAGWMFWTILTSY